MLSGYETGVVKWYDELMGCGMIIHDGGGEVYVHYSAILCGEGECVLQEGNRVRFIIYEGIKGMQAQDVEIIN